MKYIRIFLTILGVPALMSLQAQSGYQKVIPAGQWQFRQAGTLNWLPATVPGTVHSDLLAAGKIEDPFYRLNEIDLQWIDKVNWDYRTVLNISQDDLSHEKVSLVFEGLDTYADVYLNENKILSADNMFITWRVDVKKHLKPGENQLNIFFTSPVIRGMEKQERFEYGLPASNDQSKLGGMGPNQVSIFTRKAGYHFGWDWGPRLVTSGVWRPVYLEMWNTRISGLNIIQKQVVKSEALLTAEVEVDASSSGDYQLEIRVNDILSGTFPAKLPAGSSVVKADFSIKDAKLWWPNGLGDQPLYKVTATLKKAGNLLHSESADIGLRTIKLVRKPDAKGGGESFYFEVNGRPVFAKGANYIPNDVFLPRVTPEKYEFIVKSAAEANMNMLRVWGGGIYENDLFYDLCDKYGIMVWQDFMFSCSMYPGDDEFLTSVRLEAEDNVKRLRNHACMALWCGNNEIELAWAEGHENRGWGWKQEYNPDQRKTIWKAYDTVFHHILPAVVEKFTYQQPYWHSSPSAGMGKLSGYDSKSGDMHYWGVWHGQEPFSAFRKYKARFMSEYGFQSFPEFNSVKKYTLPEDWDIESAVMASHQRSGIGNLRIRQYMEQDYRIPDNFEHLLYVGQLLQAEAIKIALRTHRSDMPYCMGSLYWQLNDVWPVASWSGIDYYGKYKALHYFAKEALKNQMMNVMVEDGKLKIYGVSDLMQKTPATIRLNLTDFSGLSIWNRSVKITLPANNASLVHSIDLKELPIIYQDNQLVLKATLVLGTKVLDQDFVYFAKPKDLKLPDPGIKTRISDKGDKFVIEITTQKLCKNLMLISDNTDVQFSDNFFDLMPGDTRLITCPATIRWEDFEKGFRVLHLQMTMK
ncbi:MAG: glycoside hydrolase family 2 protein [Lentimicrobium sp.]|nr:glycoside hydrolase family 2 protein [Lentimicrobium sp.]